MSTFENTYNEFAVNLQYGLSTLKFTVLDDKAKIALQQFVDKFLDDYVKLIEKPIMPYEGMKLTKGEVYFKDDMALIKWTYDFEPAPRFTRQHGEVIPLGFSGDYDLYIGVQGSTLPTLVARYGNEPGDYLTYNPTLQGHRIVDAAIAGEHFSEAAKRANFAVPELFPLEN